MQCSHAVYQPFVMRTIVEIEISPHGVMLNGASLAVNSASTDLLHEIYRSQVNDYPKFFKMDGLSKLGFLASELLLKSLNEERFLLRQDRAVILFGKTGSIEADRHYQQTISNPSDYYPSPSVFVYTLPNIVTGEIAIRNHYQGETSFYCVDKPTDELMKSVIQTLWLDPITTSVLVGWVEYVDSTRFLANLKLIVKS